MLQVASFSITDADGVNTLLSKFRLAEGARILISNGHVLIPFENGEPKNNEQKIVDIREQTNKLSEQIDIIKHSQSVLEFLKADATSRMDEAVEDVRASQAYAEVQEKKSPEKKAANEKIDEANKRVSATKQALNELNTQFIMNDHEVLRLQMNIEKFNEIIATLA
jgi:hypothetical protein